MRDITGIDPTTYSTVKQWTSWDREHSATVLECRPSTVGQLVAAMWMYRDRSVRPIGSSWSLSDVTRPLDVAIDLAATVPREQDFGFNAHPLQRSGLNARYYLVLGGARLYQINEGLWKKGHSFPTLGGSHGQTLAGAMGTGTHGGDFAYSSICDAVRAVHLVVPGGKEYWIEPAPGNGVVDHTNLKNQTLYPHWDDAVEIVQDDDLFAAVLLGCGRLGVVFAVIVEVVTAFYQEQETLWESWKPQSGYKSVEALLRVASSTRNWSDPVFAGEAPFDSFVGSPSFLEVHYDPKGNSTFVRRRWRSRSSQPRRPRPDSPSPASDAHDLGVAQFFSQIPIPGITEAIFAAEHRKAYAQRLTDNTLDRRARFKDANFRINVGVLTPGTTWAASYREFWEHGPFVESMEFFFNADSTGYIDFVNAVHDQDWGAICGGYIAMRFTRTQTNAFLGLARWPNTVAVEITILRGFHDAAATQQKVLQRARDAGVVAHWGQENPNTAPAIQRRFGAALTRWRSAIPRLLGAYADRMSNIFTRAKGLEYGPALRIGRGVKTAFWLGYNEVTTSTLFHRGFIGPVSGTAGLRFTAVLAGAPRATVVVVEPAGQIQAGRWVRTSSPPAATPVPRGSLVIRRKGRLMGIIAPTNGPRGDFYFDQQDELPNWVTK